MKNKIISAIISFAFMFGMLYVGVPALAVVFLQAMLTFAKDVFFNIFCKKEETNQVVVAECIGMAIAFIVCLATGYVNWGW